MVPIVAFYTIPCHTLFAPVVGRSIHTVVMAQNAKHLLNTLQLFFHLFSDPHNF